MKAWTLIKRLKNGHYYFANEDRSEVAIADESIAVPGDPGTTDDGLLLLDKNGVVQLDLSRQTVYIPVIKPRDSTVYHVTEPVSNAAAILPLLRMYGAKFRVAHGGIAVLKSLAEHFIQEGA